MAKGLSTSYTDFYKNNSKTPVSDDEDEDTILPTKGMKPADRAAALRKKAIKRRLLKTR